MCFRIPLSERTVIPGTTSTWHRRTMNTNSPELHTTFTLSSCQKITTESDNLPCAAVAKYYGILYTQRFNDAAALLLPCQC